MTRAQAPSGFLIDQLATAALVLWSSGMFDTADIGKLLNVGEDAVYRTIQMAKDGARQERVRA